MQDKSRMPHSESFYSTKQPLLGPTENVLTLETFRLPGQEALRRPALQVAVALLKQGRRTEQ